MNNHILTEGRNFKIFLKENYSVALYSNMNIDLNMMLTVLIEFAYIRHP